MPRRRLSLRLALARALGLGAGALSRALGRGGGTAISGLVAQWVDPRLPRRVFSDPRVSVVAVSGSNGKTTTAGLLAGALRSAGRQVAHNSAGSNMVQGIATLALRAIDWSGRPISSTVVAEVDEGALLAMIDELDPLVLVVTNVVRDQLDRYGEIYAIAGALERAAEHQRPGSALVLCADDPLVAQLAPSHPRRRFVGLELAESHDRITSAADSIRCPICRTPLEYRAVYLGHLGDWRCPSCGLARPPLDVAVTRIDDGPGGSVIDLRVAPDRDLTVRIPQRGLHIGYDAALAVAAAAELGIDPGVATTAMADVRPAWGRLEQFEAAGRTVLLAFAKNPMSYRTVLPVLESQPAPVELLVAHSSSVVDGEDFGWLWDVEFDRLAPRLIRATVSGDRAAEIANRLAYADWPADRVRVVPDVIDGFSRALAATPAGGTLVVISGYSPLRSIVEHAQRHGWTRHFWEA
ncbi:MAG TPA: MurT ligase domain-containing protein [Candidatus Limnocylindrales bacterium]|nr:MurT ligase domain-containing protein [Candidatus Limnocylindrales bacterium]